MKSLILFASLLLVILSAALFLPGAQPYIRPIAATMLIISMITAILSMVQKPAPAPKPIAAEAIKPAPVAPQKSNPQTEVVTLLGIFQEKGRLVDFLMDDITPYTDAQVGSVVRAVHQGCKVALQEHFNIEPVAPEAEGSTITVPAGYPADEFRLVGNLKGEAPFKGTLVHKGWKVKSVKLPRIMHADDSRLPAIAPAEVELS